MPEKITKEEMYLLFEVIYECNRQLNQLPKGPLREAAMEQLCLVHHYNPKNNTTTEEA
jgi:hypothetical protein